MVVPLSRDDGTRPPMFETGSAKATLCSTWSCPRSMRAARRSARICTSRESPFGSCWTTATREISDVPKTASPRFSTTVARECVGTSPATSVLPRSMNDGSCVVARTAATTQAGTIRNAQTDHEPGERPHAISRGYMYLRTRLSYPSRSGFTPTAR